MFRGNRVVNNETMPLLLESKTIAPDLTLQLSLQQSLTLKVFSLILQSPPDCKEFVLLAALCKVLFDKSNSEKTHSESYYFKFRHFKAKYIIPSSIKLNLSKLQKLETFINTNSFLKEHLRFSPLLLEEKSGAISTDKRKAFKKSYFQLQGKLPYVLEKLNNKKYMKKYIHDKHQCAPVMCGAGAIFSPFAIGALLCCGLAPPFYVFGSMSARPMGTGGGMYAAGIYSFNKMKKIQGVVIEIGELSGFNFVEKFVEDCIIKQRRIELKNELDEIKESGLVSQQIRFFSNLKNEDAKNSSPSLGLTSS